MSSISEEKQKVIDGLMNYSLRPYAEANGIPLNELILQLYEYHNNVLVEQYKTRQMEYSSDDEETKLLLKIEQNQPVSFGPNGLSNRTPKPQEFSTVGDSGELIEIELCADSGACDSVMPKEGACARIPIVPSAQSQRGMEYKVANAQIKPCL